MNTDPDALTAQRKKTARVVCLVAAVIVLLPCLGMHWVRAPRGADAGISLLFVEGGGERRANLDIIDDYNAQVERARLWVDMSDPDDRRMARKLPDKILGTFAYAGIATIFFAVIAAGALIGAGVLAFKDRFIRTPIPLTTVALLALTLSLVCGCVFLGSIPNGIVGGGVGWPFFLYGVGVIAGLAGSQMLAKAYAEVRDPYWDGLSDVPPGA